MNISEMLTVENGLIIVKCNVFRWRNRGCWDKAAAKCPNICWGIRQLLQENARLRDSKEDEMPSDSEGVVKKSARTPSTFVRSIMDNDFSRRKGRDTVEA